jgi:predicted component of type VI protein secretion system
MKVRLVILGGKADKRRVVVELPTVIGRSRAADLTVAHPMISRKHCEIYESEGAVMIRDLGSLNGLFAGDEQVTQARLASGAEFSVGPVQFRVEYDWAGTGPAAAGPPPADGPSTCPETGDIPPASAPSPEMEETLPPPDDQDDSDGFDLQLDPSQAASVAPPDGQLPDFSAWGRDATELDEQTADEAVPPTDNAGSSDDDSDEPAPSESDDELDRFLGGSK